MTHLEQRPDMDDLPHKEWKCEFCNAANSCFDADCQFCEGEPKEQEPPFYTVAIYLEDRAYGGPEEGGWWYDCGERIDDPEITGCVPAIFRASEEAMAIDCCRATNDRLNATANDGRREISSVLSTGRYVARVCEGYPEPFFPTERPHYE